MFAYASMKMARQGGGMSTARRTPRASAQKEMADRPRQGRKETREQKPLGFSAHALARIEKRGVALTDEDVRRLSATVGRMEEKGVRDALIYFNHTVALIVSVENRTVVTAVDEASALENIFTNIDSVAIL